MKVTRRQFLKAGASLSAAASFPSIWWRVRQAQALELCENGTNLVIVQLDGGNDGINTVIPLSGANDTAYTTARPTIGIATNQLSATQIGNDPLHNGQLALHPHMARLRSLYDSGNLAAVLGVHYANGNLSHDVSKSIWYRGDPALSGPSTGWMGRTLDEMCAGQSLAVPAVDTQDELSPLFYGNTSVLACADISDFVFPYSHNFGAPQTSDYKDAFKGIYDIAAASGPNFVQPVGSSGAATIAKVDAYGTCNESFAKNLNDLINGTANGSGGFGLTGPPAIRQGFGLARGLRTVFALLKGEQPGNQPLGCRIFRVNIGGFDNHSDQGVHIPLSAKSIQQKVQSSFAGEEHGKLLYRLDRAVAAFWQDLVDDGNLYKNTLIMTFSEFGRRVEENTNDAHAGTDHGTAAPLFIVGPKAGQSTGPSHVVGYNGSPTSGMYGGYPELDNLDDDQNPVYQLDFRHVYGEIINRWLGLTPSTTQTILGGYDYLSDATPADFLV